MILRYSSSVKARTVSLNAALRSKGKRQASDRRVVGSFDHDGQVVLTHQKKDGIDFAACSRKGFSSGVQAGWAVFHRFHTFFCPAQ